MFRTELVNKMNVRILLSAIMSGMAVNCCHIHTMNDFTIHLGNVIGNRLGYRYNIGYFHWHEKRKFSNQLKIRLESSATEKDSF